jgi:uncharacterized protein
MLALLSPSKTIDFSSLQHPIVHTEPEFGQQSLYIARQAKQWSVEEISQLMGISNALAHKTFEYNQTFTSNVDKALLKQALFAFNGDAYQGLDALSLSDGTVLYTQDHLRILSGMYGVLRPLDLIQPHRMEMGLKFKIGDSLDLYHFWGDVITQSIQKQLEEIDSDVIVNLASVEYSKALNFKKIGARVITPTFVNHRNGEYRMISFWAKKARGKMTRFIMEHQLENPDDLMGFDHGYYYDKSLSKPDKPVFVSEL